MKTFKTKTIILLLVTIIGGAGLLTSCDAILEAFYPELTEMTEGEIVVYVNFDSNLLGINEFVYGSVDMKVALIPFLETSTGFYMQEEQAIVKSISFTEFQNRYFEIGFFAPENKIYKIIVWVDRNNNDTPEWDDAAYPEPSRLATNIWNGDWWVDYRWGFDYVEMDAYVALGDEIVEDQLLSHPDEIGGTGGGEPPIASPQAGRTSVATGESVNFWSNSYDPDGFIVDREWWISGPGVDETFSQPNVQFYFPQSGEYYVYLKVWDNDGNDSGYSQPIRIYVVDTYYNEGPTAGIWADMTYVTPGEYVGFQSNSWDPDDGIMQRYWDFGDGNSYVGNDYEWHSYASSGTYTVTLTVTDYSNETDSATIIIYVAESTVNRSITVEGDINGINSYTYPIRIKILNISTGDEVASRTIYGASYVYETFNYLPEANYAVLAWWDSNNNWNPDPGEPGAFGDDSQPTSYFGLYDLYVPTYNLNVGYDLNEYAGFYFDNTDTEFLFAAPSGTDAPNPDSPIGLGTNTTHFGGYVEYQDYSYYWIDDYSGGNVEIQLMNLSADVDLYVYGSTQFNSNYNTANPELIDSSTWGGTTWESVNVYAGSYNTIFIVAHGYQEGSYEVRIDSF
jgi:PKD repeat protein